jgi:type IV secretory pathway TrbD component
VPLAGPLIEKTASLSLTVPRGTFPTAFARAETVAASFGGFVASSSSGGTKDHSGELTIRVPAERFDDALAALRPLGRVDAQTIAGKDVTAQYVDLNARLATWKAQEAALIRLMAKAASVDDTLRVQTQLQRVQLTIEELQGQIRLLNDQTANATITVALAEAGATPTPATKVTNPSLGQGWRHAVAGFFGVLFAVVVGAGYVLPIAAFGLALWLIVRWTRRRTAAAVA